MKIASIKHRALRRFAETGDDKGVIEPEKVRELLAFVDKAGNWAELATPPNFKFHKLKGFAGTYAMRITGNWRLTFTKVDARTVADLDIEDYH